VATGKFSFEPDFKSVVLQINGNEPTENFAKTYFQQAQSFYNAAQVYRQKASELVQA
jgi:sulfite reductase (ferredoxin)